MRLVFFVPLVAVTAVVLRLLFAPSTPAAGVKTPDPVIPTIVLRQPSPLPGTLSAEVSPAPSSVLNMSPGAHADTFSKPKPPGPLFLLDEAGKAVSIAELPATHSTPFTQAASRYGLPTARLEIRMAGARHPETVSPMEWSVDVDGNIRETTRKAAEIVLEAAIIAVSLLAGAVVSGLMRLAEVGRAQWPSGLTFAAVFAGIQATAGLQLDGVQVLVLLAVASIWLPMRARIGVMLAGLSLTALVEAATTEIVPPHAALADLYGPLGVMGWDIAWLFGLGALGLTAVLLLRPALFAR
ncbi:hypothetical protein ACVIGB_000959 [Bradyrhizobium sp. USDA 4341]